MSLYNTVSGNIKLPF